MRERERAFERDGVTLPEEGAAESKTPSVHP